MLFDSIDDSTILVFYEFDKIPSCALQLCFPGVSDDKKNSACNAGNLGWIPGLGRSPGEGNGIIVNPPDRYLRQMLATCNPEETEIQKMWVLAQNHEAG